MQQGQSCLGIPSSKGLLRYTATSASLANPLVFPLPSVDSHNIGNGGGVNYLTIPVAGSYLFCVSGFLTGTGASNIQYYLTIDGVNKETGSMSIASGIYAICPVIAIHEIRPGAQVGINVPSGSYNTMSMIFTVMQLPYGP